MKVLVVGGTGFLGSRIVRKLILRNHDVSILTRNPEKAALFDSGTIDVIQGDILTLENVAFPDGIDVLVYAAMVPFKPGRISIRKFRELENKTAMYFENIIRLAERLRCPLILTSGASFDTRANEIADEHWPITRVGMAALGKCYDAIVSKAKSENNPPHRNAPRANIRKRRPLSEHDTDGRIRESCHIR